jgi:hypothetical protein
LLVERWVEAVSGVAPSVHGVYDVTNELYNGRMLFRKRKGADCRGEGMWLRFTASGKWVLSPSDNKNTNDSGGYATHIGVMTRSHRFLPPESGWDHDGVQVICGHALESTVSCVRDLDSSICALHSN